MKYKKIFKWELFLSFILIIAIITIFLNLFVTTIFKNIFDREINNRLNIIGEILQEKTDALAFNLSREYKETFFYKKVLNILMDAKNQYGIDFFLVDKSGKICIGTSADFQLLDKYFLNEFQNSSITFFDKNTPTKIYLYPYKKNDIIYGYILMLITGNFLNSFIEIKKMQTKIIISIFIIAFIISFLFSYIFTARIERTIKSLEKISKGDLSHRVMVEWFDEISFLQEQINKMLDNIKELQESKYQEMQIVAMGLAHEIKNPVAAIFNLVELIERKKTNNDIKNEIENIKSEIIRLNTIVDKFISFARDEKVKKDLLSVYELVELIKRQAHLIIINICEIKKDTKVPVDEVLIERVFKNLAKNSIEAGAKKIEVEIKQYNDKIIINFSDDGNLVPETIKDKIFIPFFTTKSSGMGIGLAIVKNIIQKHNGNIKYEQINNKNNFVIELPLS